MLIVRGIGNIILSSTSNTKNRIVIIKNRKENILRVLWSGSNPHSKGENFSRSLVHLIFSIFEIIVNNIVNNTIVINKYIILLSHYQTF